MQFGQAGIEGHVAGAGTGVHGVVAPTRRDAVDAAAAVDHIGRTAGLDEIRTVAATDREADSGRGHRGVHGVVARAQSDLVHQGTATARQRVVVVTTRVVDHHLSVDPILDVQRGRLGAALDPDRADAMEHEHPAQVNHFDGLTTTRQGHLILGEAHHIRLRRRRRSGHVDQEHAGITHGVAVLDIGSDGVPESGDRLSRRAHALGRPRQHRDIPGVRHGS